MKLPPKVSLQLILILLFFLNKCIVALILAVLCIVWSVTNYALLLHVCDVLLLSFYPLGG